MNDCEFPKLACVLTGGPNRTIDVEGATYSFEWHPNCGPCSIRCGRLKFDETAGPPEEHLFWEAVRLWATQGERHHDGHCIYELGEVILYSSARQIIGTRPRKNLREGEYQRQGPAENGQGFQLN